MKVQVYTPSGVVEEANAENLRREDGDLVYDVAGTPVRHSGAGFLNFRVELPDGSMSTRLFFGPPEQPDGPLDHLTRGAN